MTDLLRDLEAAVAIDRDKRILSSEGEGRSADALLRKFQSRAGDFIRTHHAAIAEALKDAALWRYLVRENNKGGRGAFRIVWFDEGDDGFTTTDGVSVDGKDEQAIIRIVSDALHNSAREVGE
jgi:hypothetical protein